MLALVVAAAVAIFILFSAHVNAGRSAAMVASEPISMPVDVIARYASDAPLADLSRSPHVSRLHPGLMVDVVAPWGQLPLVALEHDSSLWADLELLSGRLPGPGEALVPAAAGFPEPGSVVEVLHVAGPASRSWQLLVVGTYAQAALPGSWPLLAVDSMSDLGLAVNMLWLDLVESSTVDHAFRATDRPQWLLTPESSGFMASRAVGDVYGPFGTVMLMVFALSGMGVLNIMLLGFLERRKSLGIMKACGLQSVEMMALLLLEAVATAGVGFVLGTVSGVALVSILSERAGVALELATADVLVAGAGALAVAALGAYLPARMGQRSTVLDLVSGR